MSHILPPTTVTQIQTLHTWGPRGGPAVSATGYSDPIEDVADQVFRDLRSHGHSTSDFERTRTFSGDLRTTAFVVNGETWHLFVAVGHSDNWPRRSAPL